MKYGIGLAVLAVANMVSFNHGVSVNELKNEQIVLEEQRKITLANLCSRGIPKSITLRKKVAYVIARHETCNKFETLKERLMCGNTFLKEHIEELRK